MPVRVQIDPVERSVEAAIRDDLSSKSQQLAAADFARAGIAEAQAINRQALGRIPRMTVTVDGREGAPLESVKPDGGTIIVEFELISEVLRAIAEKLIARSPRQSGDYIRGHEVFAGGRQFDFGILLGSSSESIPKADVYFFVNAVPYAARIEIGTTKSGRRFVMQVPNRIYERVAKDVRGEFRREADIQFSYQTYVGAYVRRSGRSRSRRRKAGSSIQSPAIIVRMKKG
jgi:hypothetical protein